MLSFPETSKDFIFFRSLVFFTRLAQITRKLVMEANAPFCAGTDMDFKFNCVSLVNSPFLVGLNGFLCIQ
jgi:hypothetical protein